MLFLPRIELRGGVREFGLMLADRRVPQESLIEGAAGTGKTIGVLACLHSLLYRYPGTRALMVRQTRSSMSESVMATFENKILDPNSPIHGTRPGRAQRRKYQYPNGSEIVLGGLDRPQRFLSAEYDCLYLNEGIEADEEAWETLLARLRNGALPFPFAVVDTNPGAATHWLNKRPERLDKSGRPAMHRFISRLEDNPAWDHDQSYIERLDRLTGVRLQRFRYGKWVSAEGLVYPSYDPGKHRGPRLRYDDAGRVSGLSIGENVTYFGGIDWGFARPGNFQLYALDKEGRIHQVLEIYRRNVLTSQWAKWIAAIVWAFRPVSIVADPADPDARFQVNRQLEAVGSSLSIRPAYNRMASAKGKPGGLDLVRDAFASDRITLNTQSLQADDIVQWRAARHGGVPPKAVAEVLYASAPDERLPNGPQGDLEMDKLPACLSQELDAYVMHKAEAGRLQHDKPDPMCEDHGCDVLRYCTAEAEMRLLKHTESPPPKRRLPMIGEVVRE